MHVKKTIDVVPTGKSAITQRCGDCLHFKMSAKFNKPCHQLGIKSFAAAPSCYTPNVYLMAQKSPDLLSQLGLLLHNFTTAQTRVLLSLLNMQKTFAKSYGLKFGQPVYFRIGNDYLGNYFRGYVAGVGGPGEDAVYVTSDLGGAQKINPMIAHLMRESLMTVSQFKKHRIALQESGALKDPEPLYKAMPKKVTVDYEVPTMENVPAEWYADLASRLSASKAKLNKNAKIGASTTKAKAKSKSKKPGSYVIDYGLDEPQAAQKTKIKTKSKAH